MAAGNGPSERERSPLGSPLRRRRARLAGLAVLAALVGLGFALGFSVAGRGLEPGVIMEHVRGLGGWGQAAVIGLMVLHCFVPFPAEILALAAGALYGTALGTGLIWAGAMVGAALSFALARWLGRPFVETMLGERSRARLDAWTVGQGAVTLLVVRFIPVIAFNLINYAAGLTAISWWTFSWATGIGILPLTFLMVVAGDGLWSGNAALWLWLIAAAGAAGLLWRLLQRRRRYPA